jgi:ribonuclease P protein component
MLKRAVDRNHFKRIIRESFRHLTDRLTPKDYVIRLRFNTAFDRSTLSVIRQDTDDLFAPFLKKESLP